MRELSSSTLNGGIRDTPSREELERLKTRTDVFGLMKAPELSEADLVFPVIHGTFGEDGHLQALLDAAGLPYVGSGMLGQALAMNKDVTKHLFAQNGIPTAPWKRMVRGAELLDGLTYPVVVKPAAGGSTIGVSICRNDGGFSGRVGKRVPLRRRGDRGRLCRGTGIYRRNAGRSGPCCGRNSIRR